MANTDLCRDGGGIIIPPDRDCTCEGIYRAIDDVLPDTPSESGQYALTANVDGDQTAIGWQPGGGGDSIVVVEVLISNEKVEESYVVTECSHTIAEVKELFANDTLTIVKLMHPMPAPPGSKAPIDIQFSGFASGQTYNGSINGPDFYCESYRILFSDDEILVYDRDI